MIQSSHIVAMSNPSYQSPPEQHTFSSYPTQYDTSYSQPCPDQIHTDIHGSLHPQSYTDHNYSSSSVPPADAVSMISAKPEEAKPVLESHITHAATSQIDSVNVSKPHLLSERNDFILDWALKILGVATAILFGIWAPISYKITADGNAGNDEAQASLMSAISSMRDEAKTAAFAQRSAATALSKVQNQLANIGLLRAYEICLGESAAVCKSIMSHASIEGALSSLGGLTSSYASSAAPSATDGAGGDSGGGQSAGRTGLGTTALVAVILGAVFGGIVIIGLIVGVLARRRRLRKIWEGTSM
jgi:hypothetical protein